MKEIPLTQGRYAMVDDDMYDELSKINWYYNVNSKGSQYPGYANAKIIIDGKRKTIAMHRYILGIIGKEVVDHIDGDSLNNQRENLRATTQAINLRNTYKNKNDDHVMFDPSENRWVSFIWSGSDRYIIGYFDTEESAESKWVEVLSRQRPA